MTPEELLVALEARILGPRRYTADELVERAGVERAQAEGLWTGLGFPPAEPDEVLFSDEDLDVLSNLARLEPLGVHPSEVVEPLSRVLGQTLSRVASAQVEALLPLIDDALDQAKSGTDVDDALSTATNVLVPSFERFFSYTWRRHLVAALRRDLTSRGRTLEIVGFADLVSYTRTTRELHDDELSALLTRFEQIALEQVTAHGGRVIKTIGDAVMFSGPAEEAAAQAALDLVDACLDDEVLLGVRIGLASGEALALGGDLYGETVNRASRLAELARPDTVLADRDTAAALAAGGRFTVRRLHPRELRGLGHVKASVIRPPAT